MNMNRINYFIETHPDLFEFRAPHHVHPHDRFVDRMVLQFLPHWVTPNRITLFRVLATPVVFLCVFFDFYVLGSALFLLTASTDVLDGSLARTKQMITEFGVLFDPLADKFLVGSLILLLVFEYYPVWVGSVVLCLEIVFIISALVYKARFKTARMANIWGKVKMLMQ
jgi:CDP-diacylglycerol--glycerol-3-phosphate 3-phosphatidyltransferase